MVDKIDAPGSRDVTLSLRVGSEKEVPVFFPADDETLFGILTLPTGPASGTALIILAGGSTPVTTNRNRLSVRLCRWVAALGFHAMRLDYHGAGESTGIVEAMHLDKPFTKDLNAAMQWLRGIGVNDFVLVGSCFGSRTALAGAAANSDVTRLVLVSPPVRDMAIGDRGNIKAAEEWSIWRYLRRVLSLRVLKGLFNRYSRHSYARYIRHKWAAFRRKTPAYRTGEGPNWVSEHFLRHFKAVVERGVEVFMVYGEADGYFHDFQQARSGRLGALLDRAGPRLDLRVLAGQVHGFTRLPVQDAVLEAVAGWLKGQASTSVPLVLGLDDGARK